MMHIQYTYIHTQKVLLYKKIITTTTIITITALKHAMFNSKYR